MASPSSSYPFNLPSTKNFLTSVICQPWTKTGSLVPNSACSPNGLNLGKNDLPKYFKMVTTGASQDIFLTDIPEPRCPCGGYFRALAKHISQVQAGYLYFFRTVFPIYKSLSINVVPTKKQVPVFSQILVSNNVHVPCVARKRRSKGCFAACCNHLFVSSHSQHGCGMLWQDEGPAGVLCRNGTGQRNHV